MNAFQLDNGTLVHVYIDDITFVAVDAVVNLGNPTLSNKQGLNRAILDCAGKDIVREINRRISATPNQRLNFGEVLLTSAGHLACKKIIHTVSVTFKNSSDSNKAAVEKVMRACLSKAKTKKMKSLAFPAIGTGKSHVKYKECIDAYITELKSWKSTYPKEIHFVINSQQILDAIQAAFSFHLSSPTNGPTRNRRDNFRDTLATTRRRKQPTTSTSSGKSSFQDNHVGINKFPNVPSAIASEVGAAAAAVTLMHTSTSDLTGLNDTCTICLSDFTDRKTLDKCGHSFCSACIEHSFSSIGPFCPICQIVYGKVIGLQPPGTMRVRKEQESLPGFPECKYYKMIYEIPSGIQERDHPNPGEQFSGTQRTAYLPANEEGETVLKMLQRAFEQKLIFTVGYSRTNNMTDVVTWNDIHHKTRIMGGSIGYGYPDPDYLYRVTQELQAKGITPADVVGQRIKFKISA